MGQRHLVAISLLWVGFLVVTSGGWVKDARDYVAQVTGGNANAAQPPLTDEQKQTIFKFVGGYAALWLILTAGTESDTTADAAGALAFAIALGATYLYFPKVVEGLGFAGASGAYKGDTTGTTHGH